LKLLYCQKINLLKFSQLSFHILINSGNIIPMLLTNLQVIFKLKINLFHLSISCHDEINFFRTLSDLSFKSVQWVLFLLKLFVENFRFFFLLNESFDSFFDFFLNLFDFQFFGWNEEFLLLVVFVHLVEFFLGYCLNSGKFWDMIVKVVVLVLNFSEAFIKRSFFSGQVSYVRLCFIAFILDCLKRLVDVWILFSLSVNFFSGNSNLRSNSVFFNPQQIIGCFEFLASN